MWKGLSLGKVDRPYTDPYLQYYIYKTLTLCKAISSGVYLLHMGSPEASRDGINI